MTEDQKHRQDFKDFLLSFPGDEEFAALLEESSEELRRGPSGLSGDEQMIFKALCANALAEGPQLLRRTSGNLVIMSEEDFRRIAGDGAEIAGEWGLAET